MFLIAAGVVIAIYGFDHPEMAYSWRRIGKEMKALGDLLGQDAIRMLWIFVGIIVF